MAETTARSNRRRLEHVDQVSAGAAGRGSAGSPATRTALGASVILLATALGSGELILWPYITSQAGVGLLWLAFIGFTMQYFHQHGDRALH